MRRTDDDARALGDDVAAGRLTRRQLLVRAAALGLTAPAVAALLAACGADEPSEAAGDLSEAGTGSTPGSATAPASGERGGGGTIRLLWWQAPTILNPHFAQGSKDFDASSIALTPLAIVDAEGNLIPRLAAEIPSLDNGLVASDGLSVTWKLRDDVRWHDGEPFTADDVRFTYEYVTNEATTATTFATYSSIKSVEVVDDHTVTLHFTDPNPAWFVPFVGSVGMILPEHVLRDAVGEAARDHPFNLSPVGTGPYKVVDFRPGDVVVYEINSDYWEPGKPFFDRVEMKGGGDPTSAARAVLQTGEVDYATNLQVEASVLTSLEQSGQGQLVISPGAGVEAILVNFTDPNTETNGARSELAVPHPFFTDLRVRQALALAVQRDLIVEQLYGPTGQVTANNINAPAKFKNPNLTWTYDLEQARALLDQAGAVDSDGDGLREYSGVPLRIVFQTSANSIRQRTQEIVKADLEQIGFQVELKTIDSAVFFASDPGSPDTYPHFYTDIEMYTDGPVSPYPIDFAMRWHSSEVAQQANNWAGNNITRYRNPEMDAALDAATIELDEERQVELFYQINAIATNDVVEIPVVQRNGVSGAAEGLTGFLNSTWVSNVATIADWRRA